MIRGIIALALATLAGCWLLWFQANHALWQPHIVVDPVVYWNRALSFHENAGTWARMGVNEYQPGALWFFAAVMVLTGGPCDFEKFLPVLMGVNLLLLVAHVVLARVFVSSRAAWLMLLFAVLVGPILLCRFELLVSLLVLAGWGLWQRGMFMPAGFFLGVATATKVYPVLLVPLLVLAAWRDGRAARAGAAAFACVGGAYVVVGALGLFGCGWEGVVAAMRFHFDKPFGVEGLLGSGIPLLQGILGIPLRMAPRNGIHGFESDLGTTATFLLEWCWLPAALAVVWAIACLPRSGRCAAPGALFVLLGWYVLLGKLTAPQYAWWALPFLALAPGAWMSRGAWCVLLCLLSAALIAAQIVYPLNYSEFLACFGGNYLLNRIFWLNLLKNLLWLGALFLATRALLRVDETESIAPESRGAGLV